MNGVRCKQSFPQIGLVSCCKTRSDGQRSALGLDLRLTLVNRVSWSRNGVLRGFGLSPRFEGLQKFFSKFANFNSFTF